MATPSFIKKGKEAVTNAGGGQNWVKLPVGEPVKIIPLTTLDDMISFEQHSIWIDAGNSPIFPCTQEADCPGCMIGDTPRTRGLLNVLQKNEEGQNVVRVWAMGMSIMKQLVDIEESLEGDQTIVGVVLSVKRTGSQLNTKYSVVPTTSTAKSLPPTSEHHDLMKLVGETDRDKVVEMLIEAGKWKKPKGKSAPPVEDDVTDDDIEMEDGPEEDGDADDWS